MPYDGSSLISLHQRNGFQDIEQTVFSNVEFNGGGIARTIWICRLMHSPKSLREGMVPSHWRVFQTEHPRKFYDIVGLVCATLIIKMIADGKISCTTFIKSLNYYVECWSILITKVYCYSEQAQMGQRQWCKGTSA